MLVLSPEVVAIGVSERTNALAVDALARGLSRMEDGPRWLEVVHLPRRRAYMHLDTVFTPADRDSALAFPPVICGSGPELAETYEVDLRGNDLTPEPPRAASSTRSVSAGSISSSSPAAAPTRWPSSANSGPTAPTPSRWRRG